MRILDKEFKEKFKKEFNPIITYVKNNKDVFAGIRKNCLDLYVDGGRLLEIKYDSVHKNFVAGIDEKYFDKCKKRMPNELKKDSKNYINHQPIKDINSWIQILDTLKGVVSDYQNQRIKNLKTKKREKILQQKLVHEFNEKSDYFAYDIEYVIEGLTEWVLDANLNPAKSKETKKYRKPKTLGRADIMLISKPVNNKIKIYFMEVKEGTTAFGGVLGNNSNNESAPSFGSGIVGHFKNNVAIINSARDNKPYISKYRKMKYDKNEKYNNSKYYKKIQYEFNIRQILLEEIKYCLHFYKDFELLPKNHFVYNIDIDKINISNSKDAIEMVFFLGNYKDNGSFENHLGIGNGKYAKFNVKGLLDNKKAKEINLNYVKEDELIDFKVIKEQKTCDDSGFNLEIDKYTTIRKEIFKAK